MIFPFDEQAERVQQLHAFYDKQVEAMEREARVEGGGRTGTGTHGGIGTRGATAPPLAHARGAGGREEGGGGGGASRLG